MSYDTYQQSGETSRPVELYQLSVGLVEFFLTSQQTEITIKGQKYTPTAVDRSSDEKGPDTREGFFSVRIPSSHRFAQLYAGLPPIDAASLTVSAIQREDGTEEVRHVFAGRVISVSFEENGTVCNVACQRRLSSANQRIPRDTYSGGCNYVLYDPITCRVSRSGSSPGGTPFRFTGVISNVGGDANNEFTVLGASAFPVAWFRGGQLEIAGTNETRMVTLHQGDIIRVTRAFRFDALSSTVVLQAGCEHNPSDCTDVFGNFVNYGGHHTVPLLGNNPYQDGLI